MTTLTNRAQTHTAKRLRNHVLQVQWRSIAWYHMASPSRDPSESEELGLFQGHIWNSQECRFGQSFSSRAETTDGVMVALTSGQLGWFLPSILPHPRTGKAGQGGVFGFWDFFGRVCGERYMYGVCAYEGRGGHRCPVHWFSLYLLYLFTEPRACRFQRSEQAPAILLSLSTPTLGL